MAEARISKTNVYKVNALRAHCKVVIKDTVRIGKSPANDK